MATVVIVVVAVQALKINLLIRPLIKAQIKHQMKVLIRVLMKTLTRVQKTLLTKVVQKKLLLMPVSS